ncbi:MAG TPA: sugar transferase [Acidimicrobiales bacterium]|nr:sugar transferase [Acidimicrobiales bacterium]
MLGSPRSDARTLASGGRGWERLVLVLGDATAVAAAGTGLRLPPGWLIGLVLLSLALLAATGQHRPRLSPSLTNEVVRLGASVLVAAGVLGCLPFGPPAVPTLLRAGLLGAVAVIGVRGASYGVIRHARRRRRPEPTLIVGAGDVGARVAKVLQDRPQYGLDPVGFLDNFDEASVELTGLPVLGRPQDLTEVLASRAIRRVIIAFGAIDEADVVPVVRACDDFDVDIHVVPRFFELGIASQGPQVDTLWHLPLIRLRRSALRPGAVRAKRAMDVVGAGAAMVVLGPVYLLAALAVRLSSAGPIFFRQRRVGQGLRPIDVLKFRSMHVRQDSDTAWTGENDPRITLVGRLLRRSNVDELPQLINVLKGDMSLVGPRPERPYFVRRFADEVERYRDRHRVPVGLTGWAQVHGLRGDTCIEDRARFDNYYIENWSLWLDVAILVRTVLLTARDILKPGLAPVRHLLTRDAAASASEVIVLADLEVQPEPAPVPEAVG